MKKKRVSLGIAPDDLQVGDFVSIVEPKHRPQRKLVMGRDEDGDPIMIHTAVKPNQTIPGVPHKVIGVSWPWAVFGVLIPGGEIDGPVIHDLRKIKCMRLDDNYVTAIRCFEKPQKENASDGDEVVF
ncbi:MAG: hypothetical protein H8E91_00150 [Planctomycetes bacterium]|nr:hypothetical protein [Planctomycetota bacterium]